MSAEQSPFAYAATQKAISLKDKASPKERAFIDALAVRYVKDFDADEAQGTGPGLRRRDGQGRGAVSPTISTPSRSTPMRSSCSSRAAARATSTRRTSSACTACSNRRSPRSIRSIPARAISTCTPPSRRSGPTWPRPARNILGKTIPGASHINHMPSHTWNEVGRWGDSVRANLEAWHSDLKADAGEGFAIYPDHNLHMLLYAASMDGQGAIATQAGKDYTKRTSDTMYQVLTLVRFGRFDEVVEVTKRPEREIPAAALDFSQGYAKLKLGDSDFAKAYLAKVKKVADTSKVEFRNHQRGPPARRARQHPRRRDHAHGRRSSPARLQRSRRAVKLDDEMEYDEPEPLPFPAATGSAPR